MCGLSRVGCLGAWEWVGLVVLWGVGMWEVGSDSAIRGLCMVVSAVGLRPCVVGDESHALHLNILSRLELTRWAWVFLGLRRRWVVRGVSGGWMLSLVRTGVA